MRSRRHYLLAAVLAVCAPLVPADAVAQQDVMRDAFGFRGAALDVQIETEAAGRIRLIRGQRSRIEVAGRAPNGFTSAALGGRGVRRLILTAVGSDRADFVVSVPEDVRVRVTWPGAGRPELFGALSESATFAWETPVDRPAFETIRPGAGHSAPVAGGSTRIVDIRSAHRLDRLTLRLGEAVFDIEGGRAEARGAGSTLHLDAPPRGDVGIDVPTGERFTLRLDGVDALVVDGADIRILCESVLSQTLPDGRRWLTLTPVPRGGCSSQPEPSPPSRATAAVRRT